MSAMSGVTLANLLADLEVVKPQLIERRSDLLAERFEVATFSYAVDTNILYFIGQPITKVLSQEKLRPESNFLYSNRRKQVPHIGSLFRTDNQYYHLAIGAMLAQFIGFSLSGTGPLLLPDALWPEAATMLASFASLDDPQTQAVADKLFRKLERRTINKLEKKLAEAGLNPHDLAEPLRMMVRQKVGRHEGLRRLRVLFDGGAIEQLSARPIAGANPRAILPAPGQRFGDWQDEAARREQSIFDKWNERLERAGKHEPHRRLDALALTQIELRNLTAREQGSNERTLFMTVDSTILLAAETVPVGHLNCSFAEAYLRHPAAFLNDIGLGVGRTSTVSEKKGGSEAVSILDWIDVMLNRPVKSAVQQDDLTIERRDRLAAADIKRNWKKLSAIQEDQLFIQLGIVEIEKSLHKLLTEQDIAVALAKLRDEVIEQEAEAWKNCFRVAIQLALRVRQVDFQRPTRSAPPICFEAWPDAGEAIEQFKIWGARGLTSERQFNTVRQQLEKGEDKSDYAYFLASAAFFAARGDWGPAAGLASFAREQAFRHSPDQRRGANGREACYFEAVARRHLVRHRSELARSIELIEECEEIFDSEKRSGLYRLDIVPERFALELLDIDQTSLLFRWGQDKEPEAVRESMTHLIWRYQELQGQLEQQVDQHLADTRPMLLGSRAYVLVQTEVRTIISALLLVSLGEIVFTDRLGALLSRLLDRLSHLHKAAASSRHGRLSEAETQDGSVLAEVAVAVVDALVARANGRRSNYQLSRQARASLDQKVLKSHRTFPFDAKRFTRMRDLLSERPLSAPTA